MSEKSNSVQMSVDHHEIPAIKMHRWLAVPPKYTYYSLGLHWDWCDEAYCWYVLTMPTKPMKSKVSTYF